MTEIPEMAEKRDYQVSTCVPRDLNEADRTASAAIIAEGGAVNAASAAKRLPRGQVLAVARLNGSVVGIGAIKAVRSDYAQKIARRSGTEFPPDTPELGYVAIDANHQGKGLSHLIIQNLVAAHNGPMFATTSNQRMKATLGKGGFEPRGQEWPGDSGPLSFWWKDDPNPKGPR
jgi:hypothetical protein